MDKSRKADKAASQGAQEQSSKGGFTRRSFLKQPALAAAAAALAASPAHAGNATQSPERHLRRPNIILFHSDQFRWDFVCAAGHNHMDFTPNLDAMYRRGTVFQNFITNQPLRASSPAPHRTHGRGRRTAPSDRLLPLLLLKSDVAATARVCVVFFLRVGLYDATASEQCRGCLWQECSSASCRPCLSADFRRRHDGFED